MRKSKLFGQWAFCLLAVIGLAACTDNSDEAVVLIYDDIQARAFQDGYEGCAFELSFQNNLGEIVESIEPSWWLNGVKQKLLVPSYGYRNSSIRTGETTQARPSTIRMSCTDFRKAELRIERCTTATRTCTDAIIEQGRE